MLSDGHLSQQLKLQSNVTLLLYKVQYMVIMEVKSKAL